MRASGYMQLNRACVTGKAIARILVGASVVDLRNSTRFMSLPSSITIRQIYSHGPTREQGMPDHPVHPGARPLRDISLLMRTGSSPTRPKVTPGLVEVLLRFCRSCSTPSMYCTWTEPTSPASRC